MGKWSRSYSAAPKQAEHERTFEYDGNTYLIKENGTETHATAVSRSGGVHPLDYISGQWHMDYVALPVYVNRRINQIIGHASAASDLVANH